MSASFDYILTYVDFFSEQGYWKTASLISELAKDVNGGHLDCNQLTQKMKDTFDTFGFEYKNKCSLGRKYRWKCFIEVSNIVFQALNNRGSQGFRTNEVIGWERYFPQDYFKLIDKMVEKDRSIIPIAKLLADHMKKSNRTREESEIMFSTACYTYLNSVEGVFSELVKIQFALETIAEGKAIPEANEFSDDGVWKIYHKFEKEFSKVPIFLENWGEKSNIRNAIAHSQAQYDPVLDRAHFLTKDPKKNEVIFDKYMTFQEFFAIWLQVADAEDAFRYILRLLDILVNAIFLFAFKQKSK